MSTPHGISVAERGPRATSIQSVWVLVAGLLTIIVGSLAISSGSVSAHTGFESSIPADGATLDAPLTTIIISFTNTASPAGDGFVVLDPTGKTRVPSSVSVVEDRVFTLTFDPPLTGGANGVRWSVAAPDAHPIEGSFSFTTPAAELVDPLVADSETVAVAPETVTSDPNPPVANAVDLDTFLAVDSSRPGETVARIGRVISYGSLVIALGLLAFLATTLVGRRDELRAGFTAVRVLGASLALGAAIEYVGVARIAGAGLGDSWTASAGFSTVLRIVGGAILAVGFVPTIKRARSAPMSLSSAVLDMPRTTRSQGHLDSEGPRTVSDPDVQPNQNLRWVPDQGSWTIGVATAVILGSFWFDGHTVSRGPRVVHAVLNSVHVAAGSVWAGGVITMAALLWGRHRLGRPGHAHALVVRFSGVATVALGAVAVAGMIMAVFVLDSFGELTGTVWGRVLLLKIAAVAITSGFGAYNHFVLLPTLDAAPDDPAVEAAVRSSVTAEGILLAFVVVVTASLVAAAS